MEENSIRNYKLALIQMRVDAGKPAINLQRAADRLEEAAKQGAKIAVLLASLLAGLTGYFWLRFTLPANADSGNSDADYS